MSPLPKTIDSRSDSLSKLHIANLRFAEWFCCAKVCSAKIINLCQQIKYNKGQWSRTVLNFRKWVRPVYIFCPARPVDPGPE